MAIVTPSARPACGHALEERPNEPPKRQRPLQVRGMARVRDDLEAGVWEGGRHLGRPIATGRVERTRDDERRGVDLSEMPLDGRLGALAGTAQARRQATR